MRNNGLKIKDGCNYGDQPNFINICETKKPQINKIYSQNEKDKCADRIEKPLIERVAEKKEKVKQPISSKVLPHY